MTPATRSSLTWTTCLAVGYAAVLLCAEVGVANAGTGVAAWGPRFWLRLAIAVFVSFCLFPVFLRLARRPGFLEGYGRHLTPALLSIAAVAMFAALLGAETHAGFHLIAPLVGARAP